MKTLKINSIIRMSRQELDFCKKQNIRKRTANCYIWKLKAQHVRGGPPSVVDYSIFFLSMSGPTLSPVSSLCFTWDLSQTGN